MAQYDEARLAYQRGGYGDVSAHVKLAAALDNDTHPAARAWSAVLRLQLYLAGMADEAPTTRVVDEAQLRRAPQATSVACGLGTLISVLAFDADAVEAWVSLHRRVEHVDPSIAARLTVGAAWLSWARGNSNPDGSLESAERVARSQQDAALTMEATVLQSLFQDTDGLRLARRASRMARTEGMPQPQYLANLALARHRRLERRAYLSVHILRALLSVAPRPWWPWMHWELVLAGGEMSGELTKPALQLRGLVQSAIRRDRKAVLAAANGDAPSSVVHVASTYTTVARLLLGHDARCEGLTAIASFHPDRRLASEPIWVVAGGRSPCRMLSLGLVFEEDVDVLPVGRRRRGRTDAGLCELLMNGPQAEGDYFRTLYGFDYETELHRGTRDMLYHRMRERLGSAGTLTRSEGQISVTLHRKVAVPDPRWTPGQESAILAILVELGPATPREVSDALSLPLRTAQHMLRLLADDGVCRLCRDGRQLRYQVYDTTFVKPTQATPFIAQVAKDGLSSA